MQHIQDKEFDQHFREKFEEAEMEHSANLWNNIEAQLSEKPKRMTNVWWLAAAMAVTAVAAGLMFFPSLKMTRTQVVYHHKVVPSSRAKQMDPLAVQQDQLPLRQHAVPVQQTAVAGISLPLKAGNGSFASLSGVRSAVPLAADTKKILGAMQPLRLIAHPVSKEVIVKQEKMTLPVIANHADPQANLLADADNGNADNVDNVINENDTTKPSKGIRNIGDLVNYVVDKVDKREEKFLQFKTDDDNSSLVAINIGIIRFNAKKTHTNK